ncbi:CHASE3 domain-containing protein [Flavobacterium sp. ACAM 123]|uniref:CHASE3 domain-containing protein n=1 Tax=Flavobacterium sp. ACAM 123 TaxID=1189620 RepID=UPI0002FBA7AC|nr:CHASE3 domain-containing protein [Flavobacterium sp. ACAM 123]
MKITKDSFFISLIIFAILILVVAFSLKNIYELNNNSNKVIHTYEVQMDLANNLSLLKDIETGARGFALTGNTAYTEPNVLAKPKIKKNILHLQSLIKDNPLQIVKLDSLKQLINLKIASSREIINVRKQLGLNAAIKIISTQKGKRIMDDIRKLSYNMDKLEEESLIDRNKIAVDSYFLAQLYVVLGGVISILIATFLMIINNQSFKLKKHLLKSEEVLTVALSSKQQFLSNMSHEIRTPMNAILGFTKIMLKTDLAPKQKQYLDAIKTSSDGLIILIDDILDLAKVDAGKMTFEEIPFKMESSISSMIQVFDLKIKEHNLELIKEYDSKIPEVLLGDKVRLHQILLNLLGNALKFTTKGKITVAVRLLNEDEDTTTIEFAITDTGIGIAEDELEYIFENFQQATSSSSRIFGGTGLGLGICKQLVEKQGGTISVKSKINEGATFSFTLSFKKTNAEIKSEIIELKLNDEIKIIKVLLAEDIKLNQLLMKIILDDFNFKYDIADNGKIAIEKLQTESYDIILMDLQMPEMDGYEATAYIRDIMNLKIPIIALTADVTTADVEKCKAIGMNDYISKPLDERVLYTKIIELVGR